MLERTLAAIDAGGLDTHIQFVFSNRNRGEGEGSDAFFDMVASRNIPLLHNSSRTFREGRPGQFDTHRDEFDAHTLELVAPYRPDLCILAGYLLIFSPSVVHAFPSINLHPALPGGPKGLWQSVIWEIIGQHAPETGSMTFLVTEDLDAGPPITSTRFPLHGPRFDSLWQQVGNQVPSVLRERDGVENPLFQAIRQEGARREAPLLLETLSAFAQGEVAIHDGHPVDGHGDRIGPYDLTERVEAALERE
jgi:folate-dependent phosphoribosylglycinamide formyltransferase PurN